MMIKKIFYVILALSLTPSMQAMYNDEATTALQEVARKPNDDKKVYKKLLNKKADPLAADDRGYTPRQLIKKHISQLEDRAIRYAGASQDSDKIRAQINKQIKKFRDINTLLAEAEEAAIEKSTVNK